MSTVYVVRHAKAGHRDPWSPDDHARELTAAGWTQARALADTLAPLADVGRLLSSPFVRCVQTIEPLRERLAVARPDIGIECDDRLAEGSDPGPVAELVLGLPDGSVCSSHGDVIPDLIAYLERRRCPLIGAPHFEKASMWALDCQDGEIIAARSFPPPR